MYKNNRPITKPSSMADKQRYKGPNPAHKLRHARDRPVSKALCEQGAKVTSDDIAKAMAASNVQITYVPPNGHKVKNVAKAKQKATPKTHYPKLVKQLSLNKVKP